METWQGMAGHIEDLKVMKELLKEDDDEAALQEFREVVGQVDTTTFLPLFSFRDKIHKKSEPITTRFFMEKQ